MLIRALLDLIAPPHCAGCGRRATLPWCDRCLRGARDLRWSGGCHRCAGTCRHTPSRCPLLGTAVTATTAAFGYEGVVARTIIAAKLGGHHAAWPPLGDHLGVTTARSAAIPATTTVVPIPTHPRRARDRGFDHTRILAERVATILDLPLAPALRVRPDLPDRGRRGHDRDLPADAMWPASPLDGHVLLVDDVMTTGATMRAAAHAAARAGATTVHVAVLARTGARTARPFDGGGTRALLRSNDGRA